MATLILPAVLATLPHLSSPTHPRWLLKRLEARREVWAIFPPGWAVPQLLCLMFCNITRAQLAEVLDCRSGELGQQVGAVSGVLSLVMGARRL